MPIGMSVVIITRNASSTLATTLDALKEFEEVIIYDNGSTDDTIDLSSCYSNVTLRQGEFFGFGPTKRHAVSLAKNDWILSLDADEKPNEKLIDSLRHWLEDAHPHDIGNILRENWMLGQPIRHAGWGNDWLIRLFNKNSYNFNNAMVHESVEVDNKSKAIKLSGCIEHTAVTDLSQFLEKINRYSTLRSQSSKLKIYSPGIIFIKTLFAFIRTYFFQLGVLDGWRGLVIAVANANGVFWKYMKTYVNT